MKLTDQEIDDIKTLWREVRNGASEQADMRAFARIIEGTVTQRIKEEQALPVPVKKITKSFRWDCVSLHHVPTLLIEFDPVPANSPNDSKGWADRDAMVAMLTHGIGSK